MNQNTKHTELPWHVMGAGVGSTANVPVIVVNQKTKQRICTMNEGRRAANAQFILTACNQHAALVAVAEAVEDFKYVSAEVPVGCKAYADSWENLDKALNHYKSLAKGEK